MKTKLFSAAVMLCISALTLKAQDPEKVSFSDKMGKETHHMVQTTMGFYEDPELLAFVTKIGKKLEAQMPENEFDFKYYLVDVVEPNAFATLGGYVYVTRGLLALIDEEDELACVLGHEFIHVLKKHGNKKMGRQITPAVLQIPGNIVGGVVSQSLGNLLNLPIVLTSETVNSAFDRGQENEADKLGVELASKAGYDPAALATALQKLENFSQALGASNGKFSIFSDHPVTKSRVENIDKLVSELPVYSGEHRNILKELDGLIIGQNPKNGFITEQNQFIHPDLNFSIKFPDKWKTNNTPEALTAMNEKSGVGLVLGIDDKYSTLDSAMEAYAKKVDSRSLKLTVNKNVKINGFDAVELLVENNSGRGAKSVVYWIKMNGLDGFIQITGTANSAKAYDSLMKSIDSFKKLDDADRSKVVVKRLKHEKAPNTTLEEYAKQKGLTKELKPLELINGIEATDKIETEFVKYFSVTQY